MVIKGGSFTDTRGRIKFNNEFDASKIKRVYTIENSSTDFIRGWQGHAIESRWFSCIQGSFRIAVINVDDFDDPSQNLEAEEFILSQENLDILHILPGRITAIQALEENSKLLVFADYLLGELNDEYRFPSDYFKN